MNRRLFTMVAFVGLSLSCEVGPQGATGPAGPAGSSPGSSPDCPDGYTRDTTQMNIVLCRQGTDEVVKVGIKGSAFWIDRYESSIWGTEDGTGTQFGLIFDGFQTNIYPDTFPKNGQWSVPLYAVSKKGVKPSRNMTWFQANEACRLSGKRLPTGSEWLAAAKGTIDPGDSDGNNGTCATKALDYRTTGMGAKCASDWGAEDMIGNLYEFTDEWFAGPGTTSITTRNQNWPTTFGSSYNSDATANIVSEAGSIYGNGGAVGLPSTSRRGGSYNEGTAAGIFAIDLVAAPSAWMADTGFRCVIPR